MTKKSNIEQTNELIVKKVEESSTGASVEELVELLHGFMILMEKHRLDALVKEIKDPEAGFNLYERTSEILKKMYPEAANELKNGKNEPKT
tara:strand:- start:344 stop:616 length:273 start_codon:yes stop_codon:yes gene_type:complete